MSGARWKGDRDARTFRINNLTSPFHMIFLRNYLLAYHRGALLQNALERILSELIPGGYLVVGSHEKRPPLPPALSRDPHCPWVFKRG